MCFLLECRCFVRGLLLRFVCSVVIHRDVLHTNVGSEFIACRGTAIPHRSSGYFPLDVASRAVIPGRIGGSGLRCVQPFAFTLQCHVFISGGYLYESSGLLPLLDADRDVPVGIT